MIISEVEITDGCELVLDKNQELVIRFTDLEIWILPQKWN